MPKIQVPGGWKAYVLAFPKGNSCTKAAPTRFKVVVVYPVANRPFYPQQMSVSFPVQAVADTSHKETLSAGGRVYFTPYNTIEVFSDAIAAGYGSASKKTLLQSVYILLRIPFRYPISILQLIHWEAKTWQIFLYGWFIFPAWPITFP